MLFFFKIFLKEEINSIFTRNNTVLCAIRFKIILINLSIYLLFYLILDNLRPNRKTALFLLKIEFLLAFKNIFREDQHQQEIPINYSFLKKI